MSELYQENAKVIDPGILADANTTLDFGSFLLLLVASTRRSVDSR